MKKRFALLRRKLKSVREEKLPGRAVIFSVAAGLLIAAFFNKIYHRVLQGVGAAGERGNAGIGRCDPRRNLADDAATGICGSVATDPESISGYEV